MLNVNLGDEVTKRYSARHEQQQQTKQFKVCDGRRTHHYGNGLT